MLNQYSLSPQEENVIELLCEKGHSKAVAVRLGLSARTIESHLASIRSKMDVETSVQAAAIWSRNRALAILDAVEEARATVQIVDRPRMIPGKSNQGPRRWRLAFTCATVLLVFLSVPGKDEPKYSELREAAISAGGIDWFTDQLEASVTPASANASGSVRHPYFPSTTVQAIGETVVDVVSAPGGRIGSAVKFVDTSPTNGCFITYTLWEPYRQLFIDWHQYLSSDEDVLQMSIPDWLVVTAIPDQSLYKDHPGFAVTDRSGASMTAELNDGTWYHVAVMIDVDEGKAYVWVDERLVAKGLLPIGDMGAPNEVIFGTGGMSKTPYGGFVAQVRILGVRTSLH